MRSSVQILFHELRSTAVGIHPIRAMRKASPAPDHGVKSIGGGGTALSGVWNRAAMKAPTVLMSNTPAMILIKESRALYCPQKRSEVAKAKTATATAGVAFISSALEMPNKLSRNEAVTMPMAPITKKQVLTVMMR